MLRLNFAYNNHINAPQTQQNAIDNIDIAATDAPSVLPADCMAAAGITGFFVGSNVGDLDGCVGLLVGDTVGDEVGAEVGGDVG